MEKEMLNIFYGSQKEEENITGKISENENNEKYFQGTVKYKKFWDSQYNLRVRKW